MCGERAVLRGVVPDEMGNGADGAGGRDDGDDVCAGLGGVELSCVVFEERDQLCAAVEGVQDSRRRRPGRTRKGAAGVAPVLIIDCHVLLTLLTMHRQALRRVRVRPVVVHRRRYATAPPPPDPPDPPQPKIRRTRNPSSTKDFEPVLLPDALDVLWSHHPPPHDDDLPPPENLQDALNNLLISLHPQTQHRATFPSPLGPPTEPTLALYSPLEGGDYIIDATVRELARQTHAEVLVLDAAHLAAGEWGHFGPGVYLQNSLYSPSNDLTHSCQLPVPTQESIALPVGCHPPLASQFPVPISRRG